MSKASKSLAARIIDDIERAKVVAPLRPFGDGPIEAELAARLSRDVAPDLLEQAVASALDWCLARVLNRDPVPNDYGMLTSIALVAGFAKIAPGETRVERLAETVATGELNSQEARDALSMILRVIARNNGAIRTSVFAHLADSQDYGLRGAALELLGRKGSPVFVLKLWKALRDGFQSDQLLWTLAHDDVASAAIMRDPADPVGAEVLKAVGQALKHLDQSDQAFDRWKLKLDSSQRVRQKSWKNIDYRKLGDGGIVARAFESARE